MNRAKRLGSYSRWLWLRYEFWSFIAEHAFSRAVNALDDAETVADRALEAKR